MKFKVIPPPKPQFRPIVITLETEAEAALLKALVGATSYNSIRTALTRAGFDKAAAEETATITRELYRKMDGAVRKGDFLFNVTNEDWL